MKKIIIGLLLMLCITGCFAKENCERNTEKNIMYIMMGEIIRFEFEESYDKCVKGDEEYNKNETAIVTKFELINNQAKTTFNNVDFKGKTVADALYTLEETAENNDRDINKVNLYTTSSKDYSSYLSYEVDIKIYSAEEIDKILNKTIPYNQTFELKAEVGMEYYLMYYEFLNEKEVKYYTKYQCYGECDVNKTYHYTANYDVDSDKILIVIDNGYNSTYTYDFADNSFEYGDHINEK